MVGTFETNDCVFACELFRRGRMRLSSNLTSRLRDNQYLKCSLPHASEIRQKYALASGVSSNATLDFLRQA